MNELLRDRIAAERQEIAQLTTYRDHLSDRADRLMTATLDEDLLEERVRSVLGLVRPGEYMVRMEDLDRLAQATPDTPAVTDLPVLDVADADEAPLILAALSASSYAR